MNPFRFLGALVAITCSFGAIAQGCIPSGVTDQYTYFVAVDATDFTTRETGLSGFTVYRSRNGGASASFTTPTINETDATNQPGVYELLLDEDMTIDSGDDEQMMVVTITVAGMAPVTKEFCISRPKITAGETLTVSSGTGNAAVQSVANNAITNAAVSSDLLPDAAPDAAGGLPISDAGGLDLDALNTNVNDIETDTADMQPKLGSFPDLGAGATLAGNLEDMRDNGTAAFDRSTDSLQAIRDRGDAAWTTGGAGSDPSIQSTTVASVTSQTVLVPTATPTFIDQVNGWAVYLEDAGDSDAYHLTYVTNYDQTNGEVTIAAAAPFTVASSDTMVFLPAFMLDGVSVDSLSAAALANLFDTDSGETSATAVAGSVVQEIADLAAGGGLTEAGIADAVLEELVADHSGTAGSLAAHLAAILVDTGTTLDDFVDDLETRLTAARAGYVDNLNIGGNVASQTSVDDLPTNAELATSQAAADDATLAAIAGLNNVSTAQIQTLLDAGVLSLGYVNATGDVCTMIITEAEPHLTLSCTEAP